MALCSFECVIDFAVKRIRQRREQHNLLVEELRKQLKNAGLRLGRRRRPSSGHPG
jgi:hypothetical protein